MSVSVVEPFIVIIGSSLSEPHTSKSNAGFIYIYIIAKCLSARLLIVKHSQFTFVCMYIYIYPSHFNCVGAVPVVSSPDYCVGAVSVVSSPDD